MVKDGSLSPLLEAQCRPWTRSRISTNDRQSLEADDERVALGAVSRARRQLQPPRGTITGTVTRCTGEPVLGANVRAVNVADPTIQLTRITGFDGATDGSYTIHGVPPGDYDVVVEPLAGDRQYLESLATFTRIDTDFTQEYLNESQESDCAQDTDPTTRRASRSAPAGRRPPTSRSRARRSRW